MCSLVAAGVGLLVLLVLEVDVGHGRLGAKIIISIMITTIMNDSCMNNSSSITMCVIDIIMAALALANCGWSGFRVLDYML